MGTSLKTLHSSTDMSLRIISGTFRKRTTSIFVAGWAARGNARPRKEVFHKRAKLSGIYRHILATVRFLAPIARICFRQSRLLNSISSFTSRRSLSNAHFRGVTKVSGSKAQEPCTCVSTPKKGLSNVTFAIERSASPQTWPSIAGRTPPRDPSTAIFQDAKRLSTARISCGDISKPTPRRWPARPASARPVSASARGRPRSRSRSRSRRCSHEAPRRCQIPRLNFP